MQRTSWVGVWDCYRSLQFCTGLSIAVPALIQWLHLKSAEWTTPLTVTFAATGFHTARASPTSLKKPQTIELYPQQSAPTFRSKGESRPRAASSLSMPCGPCRVSCRCMCPVARALWPVPCILSMPCGPCRVSCRCPVARAVYAEYSADEPYSTIYAPSLPRRLNSFKIRQNVDASKLPECFPTA